MYTNEIETIINEFYKLTDYKNPYQHLNKSNERQQKVCELLETFLTKPNLPQDLIMWAYWNISDNYALQRKANETYNNHKKFSVLLKHNYQHLLPFQDYYPKTVLLYHYATIVLEYLNSFYLI